MLVDYIGYGRQPWMSRRPAWRVDQWWVSNTGEAGGGVSVCCWKSFSLFGVKVPFKGLISSTIAAEPA